MFSQVAFLSAIVGSDAASAAAQAAISAQSRIDLNDEEIDSSINSTREEGISSALRNHAFAFSFAISGILMLYILICTSMCELQC